MAPERKSKRLNPLKEQLERGRPAVGVVLTMPSVQMAQAMSRMGFDWLLVDMEHYPMGVRDAHEAIAATAGTRTAPIARIHWNYHWMAKPVLDVGAVGIVYPMIRTREQTEAAVAAVKYPPDGVRGWGPTYAQLRWDMDSVEYARAANAEILTVALIEHVDAVRNIEEIVSTPGLDVAFIAPSDLSASYGHLNDPEHPDVRDAIARVEEVTLKSPAALGGVAPSADIANRKIEQGYRFLNLGSDVDLMRRMASGLLAKIKR